MKAIIGVHRGELAILYITSKAVLPGSELFIDYGTNYPLEAED